MQTPQQIRRRGWVQVVVGLLIAALIGVVTFNLAPSFLHPGEPTTDGSRYTGTPEQASAVLRLFAAVIGFGLLAAVNGAWSVATGRVSRVLRVLLVVAVVAMLYCLWLTRQALGV